MNGFTVRPIAWRSKTDSRSGVPVASLICGVFCEECGEECGQFMTVTAQVPSTDKELAILVIRALIHPDTNISQAIAQYGQHLFNGHDKAIFGGENRDDLLKLVRDTKAEDKRVEEAARAEREAREAKQNSGGTTPTDILKAMVDMFGADTVKDMMAEKFMAGNGERPKVVTQEEMFEDNPADDEVTIINPVCQTPMLGKEDNDEA